MAAKKKTGGRKYSKGASDKVAKTMHERKEGTLRSGGSGKKVPSKKKSSSKKRSSKKRASGAKK